MSVPEPLSFPARHAGPCTLKKRGRTGSGSQFVIEKRRTEQETEVMNAWSAPVSTDVAHRRASGRRRYNAVRQFRAEVRRRQVAELTKEYGLGPGVQAQIARTLGVARSTICNDFGLMFYGWTEHCLECGQRTRRPHVSQMSADDLMEWPLGEAESCQLLPTVPEEK